MVIISVVSIVAGIIIWSIPRFRLPNRHRYRYRRGPRRDTLMGRRKQVIAASSVALGIVGLITNVNEVVFVIAIFVLWTVAAIIAEYGPPEHKPSAHDKRQQQHVREVMKELQEIEDMIYAFLSQPENASLRRQVMARPTEGVVGRALVQKLKAQAPDDPRYRSLNFHQDFYDCMQGAIRRLKQDEQRRPAPAASTGPAQAFDVILTDAGPVSVQTVLVVKQLTKLGIPETQRLVNSVPATILTGVPQDEAELARDVLQNAGATVEMVVAETADSLLKRDEESRPTDPMPEFDVVLTNAGPATLKIIQAVKKLTELGLKDAQNLVNSAPSTILKRVPQDEAELARDTLQDLGATVELAAAETNE